MAHRGNSRDEHVKGRAEREASFARAMHAMETLDVTVANYVTDAVALAVWKHDRRMTPRRRTSAAVTEQVGASAEPAPRTEPPVSETPVIAA